MNNSEELSERTVDTGTDVFRTDSLGWPVSPIVDSESESNIQKNTGDETSNDLGNHGNESTSPAPPSPKQQKNAESSSTVQDADEAPPESERILVPDSEPMEVGSSPADLGTDNIESPNVIPDSDMDDEPGVPTNEDDLLKESSKDAVVESDEDDSEDEDDLTALFLPFGRVKKIMKICLDTVEDTNNPVIEKTQGTSKGNKKSKNKKKTVSTVTSRALSKDAVYLTAKATELFAAAVAERSSNFTLSANKKTITPEHLRLALSGDESYEFLQGCFHSSLLTGD